MVGCDAGSFVQSCVRKLQRRIRYATIHIHMSFETSGMRTQAPQLGLTLQQQQQINPPPAVVVQGLPILRL